MNFVNCLEIVSGQFFHAEFAFEMVKKYCHAEFNAGKKLRGQETTLSE
ncbi:MAG: hypothetical protein SOT81_03695 [Treponema sp.]|nr:hypothetical protein [Treponema sp.]